MGAACGGGIICGSNQKKNNTQLGTETGSFGSNGFAVPTGDLSGDRKPDSRSPGNDSCDPMIRAETSENPHLKTEADYFSPEDLEFYRQHEKKEVKTAAQDHSPVRRPKGDIKWSEGKFIGSGSFGQVVMGLDKATGTLMAVKKVHVQGMGGKNKHKADQLMQEIAMYDSLSHKNIVGYYGSERTKDSINIFLEYIEGGSLLEIIQKYGALSENVVKLYAIQILAGLSYLHVHDVIHRDIKAANVLVDRNGVCKLADFGTAKSVHELNGENSMTGTVNWMAPEVMRQQNYNRAADIWSVGCTIYEMITGKAPWSQYGSFVEYL